MEQVTFKWQGKLHPSGKLFRPTKKETFKLDEKGLLPFWRLILMGNEGNHMGGRYAPSREEQPPNPQLSPCLLSSSRFNPQPSSCLALIEPRARV